LDSLPLLEAVALNRGILLRCSGKAHANRSRRLRLTFDIGIVEPRAERSRLSFEVSTSEPEPTSLNVWDEEEPWWKVLGHPLVLVEEHANECVRLQWRHNDDNPKIIELSAKNDFVLAKEIL
jgi:hypothetical protein